MFLPSNFNADFGKLTYPCMLFLDYFYHKQWVEGKSDENWIEIHTRELLAVVPRWYKLKKLLLERQLLEQNKQYSQGGVMLERGYTAWRLGCHLPYQYRLAKEWRGEWRQVNPTLAIMENKKPLLTTS
jgi:hypothetical protein